MNREKTVKKTFVFAAVSVLMLLAAVTSVNFAESAETLTTIHIQSDGSIYPPNVPIQRSGDVYTFTSDICAVLVVDKSNTVIDGAGYVLYGTYNGTRTDMWEVGKGPNQELSNSTLWTIGIDLLAATKPTNLTIKNLTIKNFYIGLYLWTSNNTLVTSAVTNNIVGVLLSGDGNTIEENTIANNDEGIFFGVNNPGYTPLNIVLTHNSFVYNKIQFSGCFCESQNPTEAVHTWDDGERGNFWSDYNGTDTDGNGIGDTSYIIDDLNQDRYPLMQNNLTLPKPTSSTPLQTPASSASASPTPTSSAPAQVPIEIIIVAVIVAVVAVAATAFILIRREKI